MSENGELPNQDLDQFVPPDAPVGIQVDDSLGRGKDLEAAQIAEAQRAVRSEAGFQKLSPEKQAQVLENTAYAVLSEADTGSLEELVKTGQLKSDSNYPDRYISGERVFQHNPNTGRLTLVQDEEGKYSTGDLTDNDNSEV